MSSAVNSSSRPSVAIVDTERVDRELRKITNKLKNLALDAMRKRGNGRKIEAEITLDEDGYPVARLSKYRPPWEHGEES